MSKNRQRMMQDFRITLEKRFQTVPLEMLYLRNRAYGYMYRWQAWLSLYEGDSKTANDFYQQAVLHCPWLLLSKNFIHLKLRITLVHWFGFSVYESLRAFKRSLQRSTVKTQVD